MAALIQIGTVTQVGRVTPCAPPQLAVQLPYHIISIRTANDLGVAAGVSPAVEPGRPARRKNRTSINPVRFPEPQGQSLSGNVEPTSGVSFCLFGNRGFQSVIYWLRRRAREWRALPILAMPDDSIRFMDHDQVRIESGALVESRGQSLREGTRVGGSVGFSPGGTPRLHGRRDACHHTENWPSTIATSQRSIRFIGGDRVRLEQKTFPAPC
jgi:hypothetical protein